jgi:hypothetical protein
MQFTSSTRSQSFHLAKSCERNREIKCKAILLLSLWNFHVSLCAFLSPKFLTDHSSWAANLSLGAITSETYANMLKSSIGFHIPFIPMEAKYLSNLESK